MRIDEDMVLHSNAPMYDGKQKIQTDGRAWIAPLSVFAFERENPSLKETN